jgi:hypothetical protein
MLIIGSMASAELQVTITPAIQAGSPGETLTYAVSIINQGPSAVFLNGDSSNLDGTNNTLNDAPFLDNSPLFLNPSGEAGDSWSGPLFTVGVGPSVEPGDYSGLFSLTGGADENAQDILATLQFTVQVNEDTTPPVLSGVPSDINATADSSNGAVVTYTSPTANDAVDGSVAVSCSPASGSQFPLGTTIVTCTAADSKGNTATASFKVTVEYSWSGFLQPVDANGGSVFRLGRTVPLKFKLTGASAGITNAVARLSFSRVIDGQTGDVNEADTNVSGDSGNTFRYDNDSGLYIYNWTTGGLSPGQYELIIDLGDGMRRAVQIGLR